ncbi:hypothetical protein SCHPADRAFT_122324 [Schizopora paradoxa]|uniref:Uncharacterized protein n=1 Tax=Schizopora paradoxa TaxID=27342 RepID=A0A0H2SMM0_9AGAM|nr:hypothetical protein SCHPADRAFT_122324 [Schizopora paradoxa]
MDTQSLVLEANECFDEIRQTKIRFDNPSDAIFAQLFLKTDGTGIPFALFDTILSAIRDPSFNPKEVTFKDCGDFCSYTTSSRDRDICRRGWAGGAGLPEVVLENVFEILGDELRDADKPIRAGSSLLNYALVHPSWFVHARPALGYFYFYSTARPHCPSRSLMNSFAGPWTRHLYIGFGESVGRPSCHSHINVKTLLARLPNLQSFHVRIHSDASNKYYGIFAKEVCKPLPLLTGLEKVSFDDLVQPDPVVQQLCEVPPPNLKIVQFSGERFSSSRWSAEPMPLLAPQWLSPLLSITSLQSVCIQEAHYHHDVDYSSCHGHGRGLSRRSPIAIVALLWSRSSSSADTFDLDELRVTGGDVPEKYMDEPGVFQVAKRMDFRFRNVHNQATIWRILSMSPSLRFLSIKDEREHKFSDLIDLVDISEVLPSTIEELNITFPYYFNPKETYPSRRATRRFIGSDSESEYEYESESEDEHDPLFFSQLDCWDAVVCKALLQGRSPHLRVVRIYLTDGTVRANKHSIYSPGCRLLYRREVVKRASAKEILKKPLLPLCQQLCGERGVCFSVEVVQRE